ncbi:hypothetical protein GH714_001198 [Hevea brasiliensis]|uniref:Uncharacterized protein n=1 Tax=Hevea brasiliensis TaxID=3981 RepID=A0A6A6M7H8_HEVBR|nr:hypothetical protein GH714_001198 [Hevea brasiliensis]
MGAGEKVIEAVAESLGKTRATVEDSAKSAAKVASETVHKTKEKLEDAIHRIIVRRAAPDWLPFLPGSSYWVPPPRSTAGSLGIAQLVEKLANPLTDEESLSMTTVRGWPSSDYFIKGAPRRSMEVKMTSNKEAEKEASSNNVSKSEDEEG